MMLHTIILHFILLTSFIHLQENVAREADEAYRQGDYATAIEQYEAVLAKGCTSADLHYNLGNAYYRDGQMGRAILNYERALRLKPTMGDARENLALAESHTTDRVTPLPKLFLVRWIDTLCTRLLPSFWRIVCLVLLALMCAAVVCVRMGSTRSLRKACLLVGVVSLLLLLAAVALLIRSTVHFNAHREAIVMSDAITIKSSPEAQSTDKLVLHEGTRLIVSDSIADWYKITIADGTSGWCHSNEIERI